MEHWSIFASVKLPILRPRLEQFIENHLTKYPIVAVLGARQTGKNHLTQRFTTAHPIRRKSVRQGV